jgi:hypothetical protein
MTRARSTAACRSLAKIAVAGVVSGIPLAAVSVPAYAVPGFGGAANVLPAPVPADPPTIAPPPPTPPPPTHAHHAETEDWWGYGMDSGGGGGGG